jgi:hypothetical protein
MDLCTASPIPLLDELGFGVDMNFVLYQFPWDSWHVSRIPCKDIPIFLDEFDERKFLFRVQIVPYVHDLRGVTQEQLDNLL